MEATFHFPARTFTLTYFWFLLNLFYYNIIEYQQLKNYWTIKNLSWYFFSIGIYAFPKHCVLFNLPCTRTKIGWKEKMEGWKNVFPDFGINSQNLRIFESIYGRKWWKAQRTLSKYVEPMRYFHQSNEIIDYDRQKTRNWLKI